MSVPITPPLRSSTRQLDPKLVNVLQGLKPGQRMRIVQVIRVGRKVWTTTVEGVFRAVNYLETGLATDRVKEDDIVVVCVHFTKDNGELTSITLDEQSRVEAL
jgi:azurin